MCLYPKLIRCELLSKIVFLQNLKTLSNDHRQTNRCELLSKIVFLQNLKTTQAMRITQKTL